MRNRLLILACILICNHSFAQLVGGNAFLQGHWLEIGELSNGAFGVCSGLAPAGYHSYCPSCAYGNGLAEVYDYGHDGWAVGAPRQMGDYTFPGTPFEGWEIQVNGVRSQAMQGSIGTGYAATCPGIYYGGTLTGSVTSYSNTGQRAIANWSGTCAGLRILQETRVDTNASWVVVTTRFYNTTGSTIPGIYYLRTTDPDNDQQYPGGSFTTTNTVVYQNDADHRVLVSAVGRSGAYTYMGLGTKDCRAKCFWYSSWPIANTADLATVWASGGGIGVSGITVGSTTTNDWGYGLVYNIGGLAANDSTVISYAYIFDGNNGIDSAFPEPTLVVNGLPAPPSGPAPASTIDTFDVCAYPGMTTLPIDIAYAEDKDWTWSSWSWSPATGLSATTGAHVVITTTALPPVITYTITGTDSGVNMLSCNHRVMYLTIKTCNTVTSNNPCFGDSVLLFDHGDSVAASYMWTGPGGFTSTQQNPFIFPATYANSGKYYVTKTKGGSTEFDSTTVFVHHKPVMTISSNSPLCSGMLDTLFLLVSPDSANTVSWVGPAGFTSTVFNPQVEPFTVVNAGTYTVYGVTPYGCKDTATTNVAIVPPPNAPPISGVPAYCFGATPSSPLMIAAGTNILWYPSSSSTTGTPVMPTLNTHVPGTYTYWATQTFGCLSPKDSFTIVVYPRIDPAFTFTLTPGCDSDIIYVTNTSQNASSYTWHFDGLYPDTSASFTTALRHAFSAPHIIHTVTLTGRNAVCSGDTTLYPDARHSVTAQFSPVPPVLCLSQSSVMTDSSSATLAAGAGTVTRHLWNFADGSTDTTNGTPPAHTYTAPGIYPVRLQVTDGIGCIDSTKRNVTVLKVSIKPLRDTSLCISQPLPMTTVVTMYPDINLRDYTYNWNPGTHLTDSTLQEPFYSGFGLTSYTFTATENTYGCADTGYVSINSVLGRKLLNVTAGQTIPYGSSIQLNADNEVYYWWVPYDGSLTNPNINNPVATPLISTLYTVYGYDINGCLDSAFVDIIVDSTMIESVPSAFTPNGDGLNDVFRPVGTRFQNLVDFRVFNRWGTQIFYSNNIKNGWDGTYKGEAQDMGVYYYTITVARPGGEGANIIYKGEITLMR
jgi:gliding motility-associated-like protein